MPLAASAAVLEGFKRSGICTPGAPLNFERLAPVVTPAEWGAQPDFLVTLLRRILENNKT